MGSHVAMSVVKHHVEHCLTSRTRVYACISVHADGIRAVSASLVFVSMLYGSNHAETKVQICDIRRSLARMGAKTRDQHGEETIFHHIDEVC